MSEVLTIPLPQQLLARAEARAAHLGLNREKYVRSLIEEDVKKLPPKRKHKFASEHLIGSVEIAHGPSTNAGVRELFRAKLLAKREGSRRRALLDRANAGYSSIRQDAREWKRWKKELKGLDGTLADGL